MDILHGLNSEQKEAVLHCHESGGALLVLAGAGTGKTSVLSRRIAHRIEQGADSSKILALAFTAAAAEEMAERTRRLAPHSKALLCTFHSLALRILRMRAGGVENWKRLGIDMGKLGFDDMILFSIRLLSEFEDAREHCRGLWNEILIDEYQDINPPQYMLARVLLGQSRNLFAVGDDDQAVYGFRGADIGNVLRFKKDFPDCKIIKLEWNYRSAPCILETANRIFSNKPPQFRKTLKPAALRAYPLFMENRAPELWESRTAEEETARLACEIKALREKYSMKWSDFALLARYNLQCSYYALALKERGIPVIEAGSAPGFDGAHIETIHGSKGLQYPVVFYCGLAEGLSPGKLPDKRRERKKQLEEEKRLFYVGVTRAEALLIFLYCRQRCFKGELKMFKKSRFQKYCKEKGFSKGIKMPVILFKIFAVARIIFYMFWRIPIYFLRKVASKGSADIRLHEILMMWAGYCLKALRIDFEAAGQENIAKVDWSRPVIVIANHNSYADIPALLVATQRLLGFLAKAELARIPVLSYWMKEIGCIFIKRQASGAGQKFMDKIHNYSPSKPPQIAIFPEGTRSKTGKPGAWKSGAFRMAAEIKATILPIALKDTALAWERRKCSKTVQKASAQILEPLDVAELEARAGKEIDAKELKQELENRLRG